MNTTLAVYSREKLDTSDRQVVHDGLELIGDYIGGLAVPTFKQVRFSGPIVSPYRVNWGSFNPNIDLHLLMHDFALGSTDLDGYVPEEGREIPGVSKLGSGTAWVKPSKLKNGLAPYIIGHELAHSLGYVLPDSPQTISASVAHCSSSLCIMYKSYNGNNDSFCSCCRADMIDTNQEMIQKLRLGRLSRGTV